jgi:hypothetical protein
MTLYYHPFSKHELRLLLVSIISSVIVLKKPPLPLKISQLTMSIAKYY